MTLTAPRYVRRPDAHLDAPLQDGGAVLDRDSGEVFQLNSSAHWLWQRLLQPASAAELVAEARQQFAVDGRALLDEINGFLQTLQSRGLIRQVD